MYALTLLCIASTAGISALSHAEPSGTLSRYNVDAMVKKYTHCRLWSRVCQVGLLLKPHLLVDLRSNIGHDESLLALGEGGFLR